MHGWLDSYLPLETLARDVHGLTRRWFARDLDGLEVELEPGLLGQARSWLDAAADLPLEVAGPADLVARLAAPAGAEAVVFALFDSRRFGAGRGRYPERVSRLARLCPAPPSATPGGGGPLRVWDAGCATGESTWELAVALAARWPAARVEALGTTPWPLERLMAERAARPHDPARTADHQAWLQTLPRDRLEVRFAAGDLRRDAPAGRFNVIACHGVLGGVVAEPAEHRAALRRLAERLEPGGLLSLADRFRADRHQAAAARAQQVLGEAGLEALEPDLFRRRG